VFGAVLAARRQRAAALLTLTIAAAFDLLFLIVSELPATVPVALALIVIEAWERWGATRASVLVVAGRRRRARLLRE
jgi:hypothetical protein